MDLLVFDWLSELFDIEKLFGYLKKNKTTRVGIRYNGPLSEKYKEKLQTIADEILDAESPREYKPPLIHFDGQNRKDELFDLCEKHFDNF
uniref:Uncharacterized protein n=1 Tax=Panagrolaimus sp. ES5 TaxID=591445 RepID=A0AC34G6Y2_9BILA